MWAPPGVEDAKACIAGLTNILSSLTSWHAASNQEPLLALHPLASDYKLNVMLAWCRSVARGRCNMAHCLHTPMKGGESKMRPTERHLVSKGPATTFGPSNPGKPTATMVLR